MIAADLNLTGCWPCLLSPDSPDKKLIAVPLNLSKDNFLLTSPFSTWLSLTPLIPNFSLIKIKLWPHVSKMWRSLQSFHQGLVNQKWAYILGGYLGYNSHFVLFRGTSVCFTEMVWFHSNNLCISRNKNSFTPIIIIYTYALNTNCAPLGYYFLHGYQAYTCLLHTNLTPNC